MSSAHLRTRPGCMLNLLEEVDGDGATLEQIAELLGCSIEAVRKIEATALKKLRPIVRNDFRVGAKKENASSGQ